MRTHYLVEPTDVLFFRDGVPMSAGMGKGSGCRLPFPSTLHEGLRATLLKHTGKETNTSQIRGRDHKMIASKAFSSMRLAGPLPWHQKRGGLLLPVPLDASLNENKSVLQRLTLLPRPSDADLQQCATPAAYRPPYWPVATTPPDKNGVLHGWWSTEQYASYLRGGGANLVPLSSDELWRSEHRVGVQINPGSKAAAEGQLFAGSYLRMDENARLYFDVELRDAKAAASGEEHALNTLPWLLLGGEQRIARLHPKSADPLAALRQPPEAPKGDGPVLLKWVLITPAVFAHGSLPGWCSHPVDKPDGLPVGRVRLGISQRKANTIGLPGKAVLISWCLGKPQVVSGWDILEQRPKPTQLAVSPGGVYYFLCEDHATANELARKLHWQPRSDHYGEKGCGYGLCSFHVQLHSTSPDIRKFASALLSC